LSALLNKLEAISGTDSPAAYNALRNEALVARHELAVQRDAAGFTVDNQQAVERSRPPIPEARTQRRQTLM